jgi:hypothetical protein
MSDRDDTSRRETIAKIRKKARELDKATMLEAFRVRAATIGELQSCLCCYPLQVADTESHHPEWCPSHALYKSSERAKAGT